MKSPSFNWLKSNFPVESGRVVLTSAESFAVIRFSTGSSPSASPSSFPLMEPCCAKIV
ncbi:hypothetical protein [Niabella hibiscisoli]|uniref:hypothetical protein n=1 Tax=Niabella hibiscisoli TaxID=1825928 RepID=UPI001F108951|nr:hypothetical protein [Niabella hibiscisoli]MCH5720904.1 hypothetical protein [Niabella hibiscisoli]